MRWKSSWVNEHITYLLITVMGKPNLNWSKVMDYQLKISLDGEKSGRKLEQLIPSFFPGSASSLHSQPLALPSPIQATQEVGNGDCGPFISSLPSLPSHTFPFPSVAAPWPQFLPGKPAPQDPSVAAAGSLLGAWGAASCPALGVWGCFSPFSSPHPSLPGSVPPFSQPG